MCRGDSAAPGASASSPTAIALQLLHFSTIFPMAACTVIPPIPAAPTTKIVTRPATQLPPSLVDSAVLKQRIHFDSDKHVCYDGMPEITTMADIGKGMYGISPVAVSAPFPLFTDEAVHQMRAEAFTPEVLDNCQVSSSFATHMIRAYGPKSVVPDPTKYSATVLTVSRYATFAWQAWHNPKVQEIVSQVAGIDLVPTLPCDVGHINVSFGLPAKPSPSGEDTSAFGWHVDSTPFVVVTMLSDCTGMIGGETAIRTGSGEIVKVRGPTMVCRSKHTISFI
jgi:hypothetical protein